MSERIQVRCEINGEATAIQADLAISPIPITLEGKVIGSILREPDGSYSPANKIPLSQQEIDDIGRQIDTYIKYFRD